MELEYLTKVLDIAEVKWSFIDIDEHGFSRNIHFKINNIDYYIKWYHNVSTLTIGNRDSNYIHFNHIEFDTCYPSYLAGLRLTSHKEDYLCHITIEKLVWQKD
jgi:hypothetical protein